MPYIITTKRPGGHVGAARAGAALRVIARRAVATLEDARREGGWIVTASYDHLTDGNRGRFAHALRDLPESGGTVDPLPDGTIIEVERLTWEALGGRLLHLDAYPITRWLLERRYAEVVDAYNARQVA